MADGRAVGVLISPNEPLNFRKIRDSLAAAGARRGNGVDVKFC